MGKRSDIPSDSGSGGAPSGPGEPAAFYGKLQARLNEVTQGLSYAEVARKTGFHRETCRRYLTLGSPTVEFLSALCETQGVSIHWLLLGIGPPARTGVEADWLKSVHQMDLLLEVGRRWQALQATVSEVQLRLARLEAQGAGGA